MKNLVNNFRNLPIPDKVVYAVEALALVLVLFFFIPMKASAQSGNVYALPLAQAAGDTYEAIVLQISMREVEPSFQERAAGAGVGSALGLVLASRANTQKRFAANTAGALLGGLVGERLVHGAARNTAQEIIVQLTAQKGMMPRTITIVQPAPFDSIAAGESVYVSVVRGTWRVIRRPMPMIQPSL